MVSESSKQFMLGVQQKSPHRLGMGRIMTKDYELISMNNELISMVNIIGRPFWRETSK